MSEYNNEVYRSEDQLTFNEYMSKVFVIMAIGLAITTASALIFSLTYVNIYYALGDAFFGLVIGLAIAEIAVAIAFSAGLRKFSKTVCWCLYITYSALTGFSLSGILITYTASSVWICFAITSVMFVSMAIIGHTTKADLTRFSGYIVPALITLIVATVLNALFFREAFLQWVITYVGILLFLFLIAYDMQMLRNYYASGFSDEEMGGKLMIMAAFQLYLDFINLFIRIIQLFGKKRN